MDHTRLNEEFLPTLDLPTLDLPTPSKDLSGIFTDDMLSHDGVLW
jgi:hypothetical protein